MAFCLRCAESGLRPPSGGSMSFAQLDLFDIEVDAVDQRLDRVGTHAALEVVAVAVGAVSRHSISSSMILRAWMIRGTRPTTRCRRSSSAS